MGSAASLNFQELPERVDRAAAEDFVKKDLIDIEAEDWPEEKWAELTESGDGKCSREAFIAFCKDMSTDLSACGDLSKMESSENLPAVEDGAEDEEIFAADGELEHSMDDELALGTFNDNEDDEGTGEGGHEDDLGGMIIPDMAVVAVGRPVSKEGGVSTPQGETALAKPCEEEIIAADGEAFETSHGPGCFDEEGLSITGSKIAQTASPCMDAGLIVTGSSPGKK